ncbi:MAG: hypothetical protein RI894_1542 [Bacteroidota bacterium]|jgi:hypothetical protein
MKNVNQTFIATLSTHLFWDTNPSSIDCEKHLFYIVERVMSRGSLNDFKLLKDFYGKAKIKRTVKQLRYMDERVLHFCSIYFKTPIIEFRCYTQQQLNHTHWRY